MQQILHKMRLKANWQLYAMLIPPFVVLIIFMYVPLYGILIAFLDYIPGKPILGARFVGLKWFRYFFSMPDSRLIIMNTLIIAIGKILAHQLTAVIFALLLNEVRQLRYKRLVQTMVYLPHFLSWVIIGGIFTDLLSVKGIVNQVIALFGVGPISFLMDNRWFRATLIITDTWKEFGWGAILYLSAMAGIDQNLYEAAVIDGASRLKQTWHVTLPGIKSTIVLLFTLSLGSVLSAGFEQVLMMYNPAVYRTGDIIDTFVYRVGLQDAQFSLATAIGLFKSLAGLLLITASYRLAYRYADYTIF